MLDFVKIVTRKKRDGYEIFPDFINSGSVKDLMIRGSAFYAVWDESRHMWSRNEYDVFNMIDAEIMDVYEQTVAKYPNDTVVASTMSSFSSNKLIEWKKYLKASPDRYHELDMTVTFASDEVEKEDYVSKRLHYDLSDGECPGYEKLMSTLYSDGERRESQTRMVYWIYIVRRLC